MTAVVKELVEHHQVMRVRPANFEIGVFHVLAHRSFPQFALVVVCHIEKDFFFLHSTLCIFVCTLLDFKRVKLLVRQLECEPNRGEVSPAEFAEDDVLVVEDFTKKSK